MIKEKKNISFIIGSIIVLAVIISCLIMGGSYYLHRIAIIFTIIYLIFKVFLKNNKINKFIWIASFVISICISLINWVITAIPEPSNFFRIFEIYEMFGKKHTINGINITLSQLSSIINIILLIIVNILTRNKTKKINKEKQ